MTQIILDTLNQEISQLQYGQYPPELYEPIGYIMSLGGKRLRPVLTLLSSSLFDDNWQQFVKPAIAIEVFHNFTLMHDDIMDAAPLRRGKPTVHHKWNNNVAILSGDVMLVCAYELLLHVKPEKLPLALKKFNRCAAQVCEGQQLDMNFEQLPTVSEDEYINMIQLKTAVLLGLSLELGGILADAPIEQTDLLYRMGVAIGTGFQLKDDLLDVYGDQAKFGKQVGGDIIANKKTFLLIKALELAEGNSKVTLQRWLNATSFKAEEKVKEVTDIYNILQIRSLTEVKMNEFFAEGLHCLDLLAVSEERKQPLRDFIERLIHREN
ncbi:polyprenyl synthetase family protein [Cytophagaceae bacterium YF14B1]|uniref:Polyprenyl synthetase family protein n=1 Tax=Xanthocytophaga flava TaxID=3048013 RepID=A0AAE3U7V5_9BACT|nr:polyprenyl synthetase family protein [Xanthocytophaga flavus]MDJ1480528.1 polyprenyl synthetase family protein [Xanthocytophaga flavus]